MVVALGPGKFYGSGLPRPRIYTDMKLNEERVDPPVPVLNPLMSWAKEAHWSMGGLSFKRLRLQGRIEGSIKKLKSEREKLLKKRVQSDVYHGNPSLKSFKDPALCRPEKRRRSPSPPRAPIAEKRRRAFVLVDESEDEREMDGGDETSVGIRTRRPVRKLGDDFDRVASESGLGDKRGSPAQSPDGVAARTRSRRGENEGVEMLVEDVKKLNTDGKKLKASGKGERNSTNGGSAGPNGTRASPRLAKRGSK